MEMENLPAGSGQAVPFEQIAKESEAALKAEAAAQIKRPVGRPPGVKKIKPDGAQDATEATGEAPQTHVSDDDKKAALEFSKELKPLIGDLIKAPFSVSAAYLSTPELEASDDEVKTPAHYLSKYLNYIFPDLHAKGPKEFSLYAFLISSGILIFKKLILYAKKPKIKLVQPEIPNDGAAESVPLVKPNKSTSVVAQSAASFFGPRS